MTLEFLGAVDELMEKPFSRIETAAAEGCSRILIQKFASGRETIL